MLHIHKNRRKIAEIRKKCRKMTENPENHENYQKLQNNNKLSTSEKNQRKIIKISYTWYELYTPQETWFNLLGITFFHPILPRVWPHYGSFTPGNIFKNSCAHIGEGWDLDDVLCTLRSYVGEMRFDVIEWNSLRKRFETLTILSSVHFRPQ